MELQVVGGGGSGNPLGGVNSLIQFDEVSAMVALQQHTQSWLNAGTYAKKRTLPLALTPTIQSTPNTPNLSLIHI